MERKLYVIISVFEAFQKAKGQKIQTFEIHEILIWKLYINSKSSYHNMHGKMKDCLKAVVSKPIIPVNLLLSIV